jgi:diguanylate cyclase (GGDEF)-like protein/PAS domain S-box-containing protein
MEKRSTALPGAYMDLLLDAVCLVDADGRFVWVSAAGEQIFGYTPDEMVGRAMIDMVVPDDRARTLEAASAIMIGEPRPHFENRYLRKDGRIAHIMWSARWSDADRLRIAVARDITGHKQTEAMQAALFSISEAAHTAEDLPALFHLVHQIIHTLLPADNFLVAMVDDKGGLSFPYCVDEQDRDDAEARNDPVALALCAEIVRSGLPLVLPPQVMADLPEHLSFAADGAALCWLGVPLVSDRGMTTGTLLLKSYPGGAHYSAADMNLLHFVSTQVVTAIERIQLLARLKHMAQHDELTGLPNRGLLRDRLETALAAARREPCGLALLYLDLDRFKQVNDMLGHLAGDLLLQEVGRRMRQCVREADTVARMGGDEFVLLLPRIHGPQDAANVAEKIRSAIARPMRIADQELRVLPSIGIALYPDNGDNADQLFRVADQAMYAAKKARDRQISAD